jgi:peptide/nickel transport system permease protein
MAISAHPAEPSGSAGADPGFLGPAAARPPRGGSPSRGGSPLRLAWRRLRKDKLGMISLGVVVFMVAVAVFAPLLTALNGHGPQATYPDTLNDTLGGLPKGTLGGISAKFWLGVEPSTGRDLFSLAVYGARTSLFIATSATIVTVVLAIVIGITAGYFGGWIDQALSRLTDLTMSFPALIFIIALIAVLPSFPRIPLLILLMSVFSWPYLARLLRGQVISLREREFIEAATSVGARNLTILFRELLPNLMAPIIVNVALTIPTYIGYEAALSFLGVGVEPGTPSWGEMLSASLTWYATDPMYFVVPGVLLFLTVLAFNLFGDSLQSALDPRKLR